MRYAVFSDVHSNLEAFLVVLEDCQKEDIDRYIFLGDIVGYGANPKECISLLRQLNPVRVAGNHDWGIIDKFPLGYFHEEAAVVLRWTKKELSLEEYAYLEEFVLEYREDELVFVHGSLEEPARFHYLVHPPDAYRNFLLLKEKILFVGHTHYPITYVWQKENILKVFEPEIEILAEDKYIVNVGSVGQPRDRDRRACFCIYDSEKKRIIFKRLNYNFKQAAEKILNAGLPYFLAERLYMGV